MSLLQGPSDQVLTAQAIALSDSSLVFAAGSELALKTKEPYGLGYPCRVAAL